MSFVCFVSVVCVLLFIFLLLFCCCFCCCFVCLLMLLFCCLFHVLVFCCLFFVCLFCFVEVLDAKLNPMLNYTSEIWETVRLDNIEKSGNDDLYAFLWSSSGNTEQDGVR